MWRGWLEAGRTEGRLGRAPWEEDPSFPLWRCSDFSRGTGGFEISLTFSHSSTHTGTQDKELDTHTGMTSALAHAPRRARVPGCAGSGASSLRFLLRPVGGGRERQSAAPRTLPAESALREWSPAARDEGSRTRVSSGNHQGASVPGKNACPPGVGGECGKKWEEMGNDTPGLPPPLVGDSLH